MSAIIEDQNSSLMKLITKGEVRRALFVLGGDKAPGLDGFPAFFFQKLWDIVGDDIRGVLEESRCGGFILKDFNNTFISLIPKKGVCLCFEDFRPIALCNTIYKVISKVIANRLKPLLNFIISPEQSGFAPNRSIYEGISVAHEAMVWTAKVEKMMIKLDIKKAYDHVNYNFQIDVLKKIGFYEAWLKWIGGCINSPRISVLVNGSPQGFFETARGLRQGDPISPFLFIIMVEALGRLITWERHIGLWKGISVAEGVDPVCHLQFVDDIFLMGGASPREARVIKVTLDSFSKASGQCVRWHKSEIFFFNSGASLRWSANFHFQDKIYHKCI